MPANVCPICETPWPHNETYKTAWGTRAVRSANERCPVCDAKTVHAYNRDPLTEAEQAEIRVAVELQERHDAFEQWYADREADKLTEALGTWLALDAA